MSRIRQYLHALLRHWKVLLTGGGLIAVVVAYSLATGSSVHRFWGSAVLVATFIAASFAAWKEERQRRDEIMRQLEEARHQFSSRSPRITRFEPSTFGLNASQLSVRVHVVNPGDATTLNDDWKLRITTTDGRLFESTRAGHSIHNNLRGLPQGGDGEAVVVFSFPDDPFSARYDPSTGTYSGTERDQLLLAGAGFAISVSDIHGHQLRAEHR